MTTTVLQRDGIKVTRFTSHAQVLPPQTSKRVQYKKSDGNVGTKLVHTGVPIFRSGTFRDSWGDQMTYEPVHINQMVDNAAVLATKQILADPPVREGHPSFLGNDMTNVVGYITRLTSQEFANPVDGEKQQYLLADYEILAPHAIQAVESGLWRHRSAEVGRFVTNNEAEYWPVLMGFAFVSIPAVEGLHTNGFAKFSSDIEVTRPFGKENDVAKAEQPPAHAPVQASTEASTTDSGGNTASTASTDTASKDTASTDSSATEPQEPEVPALGAPLGAPGSAVVVPPDLFVPGVDDDTPIEQTEELATPPVGLVTPDPEPPVIPYVEGPDPTKLTERPQGPVGVVNAEFSIGGIKSRNFSQIQNYITSLETWISERRKSDRAAFCAQLAATGKILASQIEGYTKLALEMPDAQYASWCALQTDAPQLGLFSGHTTAVQPQSGGPVASVVAADEASYRDAYDTVKFHKDGFMPDTTLIRTQSYQNMVTLAEKLGKDCDLIVKSK